MKKNSRISLQGSSQGNPSDAVDLQVNPLGFKDWARLLRFLQTEFAYTRGLVDPPSTVFQMTEADLRSRAETENLLLGHVDGNLVAYLFLWNLPEKLFLGRFAIAQACRGGGLARKIVTTTEAHARNTGRSMLELETRVNLTANQAKFNALGFKMCGSRAHEGYKCQTTCVMQKQAVRL